MKVLAPFLLTLVLHQTIPIINGQECPLECFHNGKCTRHEESGQFYCNCPALDDSSSGFQGIHCEEPYIQCTDGKQKNWRCHNNGKCNLGSLGCDCPEAFDDGKFCEAYFGPCIAENGDFLLGPECTDPAAGVKVARMSAGEIVGISCLTIFLSMFLFVLGVRFERRRLKTEIASLVKMKTPPLELNVNVAPTHGVIESQIT